MKTFWNKLKSWQKWLAVLAALIFVLLAYVFASNVPNYYDVPCKETDNYIVYDKYGYHWEISLDGLPNVTPSGVKLGFMDKIKESIGFDEHCSIFYPFRKYFYRSYYEYLLQDFYLEINKLNL